MKISKAACFAGVAALATFAAADDTPVASNVTMTQQTPGRLVTITYQLDNAPAVVTLDVQTNYTENGATKWASIGGEAVCNAQGDVWKKVGTAGATFNGTIKWRPDLSWEGHLIASGGARAVVIAWALDNTPDYMVVDISAGAHPNTQKYYPAVDFLPGGILGKPEYRTTKLVMRKIMAKDVEWTMGSTTTESQRHTEREGTHPASLTNNYYFGVFPVTQSQWGLIATNSTQKGYFTTETSMRPMEQVSYNEIRLKANSNGGANSTEISNYSWPKAPYPSSFLGLLRLKTGIDFDLPSDAQWEFAARAGNGVGYWGDGSAILNTDSDANLDLLGRYKLNGGYVRNGSAYTAPAANSAPMNGTAIVGSYAPNAWGIYDMCGNVWEWCLDWYQADLATAKDAFGNAYDGRVNIDPSNPANYLSGMSASGADRVVRGGSYDGVATACRPAYRHYTTPTRRKDNFGFRVVCTAGLQ